MSLQRCSKIQRKEVEVGDDDGDEIGAPKSGSIFNLLQAIGCDDILFEIFVRLPEFRSAIMCSSVSRRWNALISHPRFVRSFTSHHQQHRDRYPPPPCTVMFLKSDKTLPRMPTNSSALDFQPISLLFSEESTFLHGKSTNSPKGYLDFLPFPMIVRASCDDLLLLTPFDQYSTVFFVCNPVTKQLYRLPDSTRLFTDSICGYALARMPDQSEFHFKVVKFYYPNLPSCWESRGTGQILKIYCSKLGKWKNNKVFFYPSPKKLICHPLMDIVMCNGILHWLEHMRSSKRVISFDLLGTRGCCVIDFPDDFWWFRSPAFRGRVREQIGTVGGELRLIQVVLTNNKFVDLKVWRLFDTCTSSWVLVHDKRYSKRPNKGLFAATFVHPTDGNMVFMVWGKSVFQYNLTMEEEDPFEMIDELQGPLKLNRGKLIHNDRIVFFPVVHPPCPTPLPST